VAKKRAPARRTRRRSTRRRNPGVVGQLRTGIKDAAGVVVGKAGARILPTLVPGIPKTGPMGLAVQAAAALALGFVADQVASRDTARMVLAGALSAPLETAAVAYNVPLLGRALDPVASAAQVAAVNGSVGSLRRLSGARRMGAYVTPGLGAYANNGLVPGM
jgi:hypothetical protein